MLEPLCTTTDANGNFDVLNNPLWCSDLWCYVDQSVCNVDTTESSYIIHPTNSRVKLCDRRGVYSSLRPIPQSAAHT